jgi:hypothetical protein
MVKKSKSKSEIANDGGKSSGKSNGEGTTIKLAFLAEDAPVDPLLASLFEKSVSTSRSACSLGRINDFAFVFNALPC